MSPRAYVLAIAAGLGLADASIVTLALPDILRDLNTSVEGVAAVIGVYTVVLAIALIPFERAASALSVRAIGAGGFALFAVASAACAGADDLTGLLVARCAQAVGAAAGLATVFDLLGGAGPGRRLWLGAAVFATALGPAAGGALTEAFSWRAIFVFQVPVAAAGAIAVLLGPSHAPAQPAPERPERFALRPALALALVSAALAAVLFLLVLLLVAGWNVSPLSAAAAVTVIPLAALGGARLRGDPRTRAAAGCALVGGGVLALAWLPGASLWWTVIPQALAGVGMGLALTALGGDLLPERTPRDAARLLAVRHAGIAGILAIAAPIAAHQLDVSTQTAKERGVALVLDAPLPPQDKIKLAPALLNGRRHRPAARRAARAVAAERHNFTGRDLATYDDLGQKRRRHAGDRGRRGLPLVVPARRRRRPAGRRAAGRRRAVGGDGRRERTGARHARGVLRAAPRHRARAAGDPGPVPPRAHAAQNGRGVGLPPGAGCSDCSTARRASSGPRARSSCSRSPTRTRPSASSASTGSIRARRPAFCRPF